MKEEEEEGNNKNDRVVRVLMLHKMAKWMGELMVYSMTTLVDKSPINSQFCEINVNMV